MNFRSGKFYRTRSGRRAYVAHVLKLPPGIILEKDPMYPFCPILGFCQIDDSGAWVQCDWTEKGQWYPGYLDFKDDNDLIP